MLQTAAQRRFFFIFLPAILALMLPLLACGGGVAVPACQDLNTSAECSTCCTGEGYSGQVFSSFGEPRCKCM